MSEAAGARALDVMCYGEALLDFLPAKRARLREVETFYRILGGAPSNVAVGCARLGCRSGLMGKVGRDEFGACVLEQLAGEGVEVGAMRETREAKTGIAFVALDPSGDRSFMFYREPSADMTVRPGELDLSWFARARCAVFGSNLLNAAQARAATREAMQAARAAGCLMVMDPNVRLHIWPGEEAAREAIAPVLGWMDVIKLNDDELRFFAGGDSAEDAARLYREVLAPAGCVALVVTRAERGAEVWCGDLFTSCAAPVVAVEDTTGAGDGFLAGLLAGVCVMCPEAQDGAALREALRRLDVSSWVALLEVACVVGSRVCEVLGATPGLPARDVVPELAQLEVRAAGCDAQSVHDLQNLQNLQNP